MTTTTQSGSRVEHPPVTVEWLRIEASCGPDEWKHIRTLPSITSDAEALAAMDEEAARVPGRKPYRVVRDVTVKQSSTTVVGTVDREDPPA